MGAHAQTTTTTTTNGATVLSPRERLEAFAADFDMIKLYDCMLKKNCILFLTVSFSKDDDYVVYYNIHRVFNSNRLKLLLKDWIVVDEILFNFGADKILVLKKRA